MAKCDIFIYFNILRYSPTTKLSARIIEGAIDRIIDFQEYEGAKQYNYDLQIILDKLNEIRFKIEGFRNTREALLKKP